MNSVSNLLVYYILKLSCLYKQLSLHFFVTFSLSLYFCCFIKASVGCVQTMCLIQACCQIIRNMDVKHGQAAYFQILSCDVFLLLL